MVLVHNRHHDGNRSVYQRARETPAQHVADEAMMNRPQCIPDLACEIESHEIPGDDCAKWTEIPPARLESEMPHAKDRNEQRDHAGKRRKESGRKERSTAPVARLVLRRPKWGR